ncbi:MAG: pteridine reductase [Gammaproteobacteria bacterium]|nr:pteridine reductase [Gammaproteobacteria bacterium]MCY4165391.1 pteridine reductase [Gammaproteobacteria bacterium]
MAKVALVTGGARRVGAATAEALHSAGFTLAVHCNRSRADADALAERLNQSRPDSAFTLQGDLLEDGACERLAQDVLERAGRLDCLVNNASTFYPTAVGEITEGDWRSLVGSNLKAPVFLSQALAPALRASQGVIVNMVDIHARIPLRGYPVYSAAKAGLAALTLSLAGELAPEVRVNGIAPGMVMWAEPEPPESIKNAILARTPLGRAGEPRDVARLVRFVVCDAPFVTGQIIAVDGGRSIGW